MTRVGGGGNEEYARAEGWAGGWVDGEAGFEVRVGGRSRGDGGVGVGFAAVVFLPAITFASLIRSCMGALDEFKPTRAESSFEGLDLTFDSSICATDR